MVVMVYWCAWQGSTVNCGSVVCEEGARVVYASCAALGMQSLIASNAQPLSCLCWLSISQPQLWRGVPSSW